MDTHIALTTKPTTFGPSADERLRELVLGAFAAVLGALFLLLLVADQAQVAAGAL